MINEDKYMDNWKRKACADELREIVMYGEDDRDLVVQDALMIIDKYFN
tara:strand:- start:525 stop:668 length:144 start_codon:yes stop_codon:yes gene_type:complete